MSRCYTPWGREQCSMTIKGSTNLPLPLTDFRITLKWLFNFLGPSFSYPQNEDNNTVNFTRSLRGLSEIMHSEHSAQWRLAANARQVRPTLLQLPWFASRPHSAPPPPQNFIPLCPVKTLLRDEVSNKCLIRELGIMGQGRYLFNTYHYSPSKGCIFLIFFKCCYKIT